MEEKNQEVLDSRLAQSLKNTPYWGLIQRVMKMIEVQYVDAALAVRDTNDEITIRTLRAQVARQYAIVLSQAIDSYAAEAGKTPTIN